MLDEFGGLPMLHDNWTEKSFHWLNFYTHAYKYGFFANDLFSILVKVDIKNTESRIITVKEAKELYFIFAIQCMIYTYFFVLDRHTQAIP